MACNRVSETASNSAYVYEIFRCIENEARDYLDRLRYFKQIKDELDRISASKQSPELVSLLGEWGQGKSSFLDIVEEFCKEKSIKVSKYTYYDIIKNPLEVSKFTEGVFLIDEVESLVDDYEKNHNKDKIIDFFSALKELANKQGNSVVYLSMTQAAFQKIFEPNGILQNILRNTSDAIIRRIRKVEISNPSKLEFYLMLKCMMKKENMDPNEILRFMDLPYWVVDPSRGQYVRFFNDIICPYYPDVERMFIELATTDKGKSLNSEGETIKWDILSEMESKLDYKEKIKFHKVLMSRIFVDDSLLIPIVKDHVVKGYLIPYKEWIKIVRKYKDTTEFDRIEDFLLTLDENGEPYIFLSNEVDKVIFEGINIESVKKAIEGLQIDGKRRETYSITWELMEKVVNTSVGGLVVEFLNSKDRNEALRFVNDNLTNLNTILEALTEFIKLVGDDNDRIKFEIQHISEKFSASNSRLLELNVNGRKKLTLIIINEPPSNIPHIIDQLKKLQRIINGAIIVNPKDEHKGLKNFFEKIAVDYVEIEINTPKLRQLLYLLFSTTKKVGKIKKDAINIRLRDIKEKILDLVENLWKNMVVEELPAMPGNKRLIQSTNWIIFYPEKGLVSITSLFDRVDQTVNDKFRMYGSKQFHLEDIESADTFSKDVITYLSQHDLVKVSDNKIYFSDYVGKRVEEFAKTFAGLMRQKYKDKAETILINNFLQFYINSKTHTKKTKEYYSPESFAYELFTTDGSILRKNQALDFLTYFSIISGYVAKYLDTEKVKRELMRLITNNDDNNQNRSYENYGYFLTIKKRSAGLRSLKEMIDVLNIYKEGCKKDWDMRLCFDYLYLSNSYRELYNATRQAVDRTIDLQNVIKSKIRIIEEAKQLLGINDTIDEEVILNNLLEKLEKHFDEIVNEIRQVLDQVNQSRSTEEFKRFIDSLISSLNYKDEYINLYSLLYSLLDYTLIQGNQVNDEIAQKFFREGTTVYQILQLTQTGRKLNIKDEINDLKKANPLHRELDEKLRKYSKEKKELMNKVREEIGKCV